MDRATDMARDTRYLRLHGRHWHVVIAIPRQLHGVLGRSQFKQSLHTDSLTKAQRMRWAVVARMQQETVLDFLREGDELVVTRIDRLARSIGDLQHIVDAIREKGATLRATEQPINTSTAAGKAFLQMLGVFAEFETNLRRERQMEGIAKAKAAGVYKGRKPTIDTDEVKRLTDEGVGPSEIAKRLGIGRASVYRVLA